MVPRLTDPRQTLRVSSKPEIRNPKQTSSLMSHGQTFAPAGRQNTGAFRGQCGIATHGSQGLGRLFTSGDFSRPPAYIVPGSVSERLGSDNKPSLVAARTPLMRNTAPRQLSALLIFVCVVLFARV